MNKHITYDRINKILTSLQETQGLNNESFLEIEYQELEDLGLIKKEYNDIEILGDSLYNITDKGLFFLNSYKKYGQKIEYFFKDYPFFGALIIGGIGGVMLQLIGFFGGIFIKILKILTSYLM